MAKYPVEKYNIIVHQHPKYGGVEIIAYSTYAGKVVRGKAICHVDDSYSEESGRKLAIARCAEKIARKRNARAKKLMAEAKRQVEKANKYWCDMMIYLADSEKEVTETQAEVREILSSL